MVVSMLNELRFRAKSWKFREVDTIYFGGGTPSLLDTSDLALLLDEAGSLFYVKADAEITLEANPDDLNPEKLCELHETGFNRLSIGIQSFRDSDLRFMNRAHNANEATNCVGFARDAGFENISIDLIYALPDLDTESWIKNLDIAIGLDVEHISAYCLTIEEGTVLSAWIKKGKAKVVNEDLAIKHHRILLAKLRAAGYEDYEISNFAKAGKYSRHNSAYWSAFPFLGIGPSAHGYDMEKRWWNVSNNSVYIKGWIDGEGKWEEEELSIATRFNEYMLTSLRTRQGISLDKVQREFGPERLAKLLQQSEKEIQQGTLIRENDFLILTDEGKLFADHISMDFFEVD